MPWKLCAGRIERIKDRDSYVDFSLLSEGEQNSSKAEILASISKHKIVFNPRAQSTIQELRTGTGQSFKHQRTFKSNSKEQAVHLPKVQTAQTHKFISYLNPIYNSSTAS
jgi:hypothetical protein